MERRLTSPRSRAIAQLDLLGQIPSPELRRTARVAAHLARQPGVAPMAAVHLLDDDFQHRIASAGGVPLTRTPLGDSMCQHVLSQDQPLYCDDATTDALFDGNPFTTGPDPVRLYYSTPVRTSSGTAVGTLCVFATSAGHLDADQRARLDDLATQTGAHLELLGLSRELAHLATHDPLTEVANRTLLSQRLQAALLDPGRRVHEPALLLVDLDDFKAVNDTHGHTTGDEVLRSVADRLRVVVRDTDLVARIGGDEFAVLLPELPDPGRLDQLAERIAEAVSAPHETGAGRVRCTVSVGRTLGRADDVPYELLGRADADMYERKPTTVVLPPQR